VTEVLELRGPPLAELDKVGRCGGVGGEAGAPVLVDETAVLQLGAHSRPARAGTDGDGNGAEPRLFA
jgi:hypothetical protein